MCSFCQNILEISDMSLFITYMLIEDRIGDLSEQCVLSMQTRLMQALNLNFWAARSAQTNQCAVYEHANFKKTNNKIKNTFYI